MGIELRIAIEELRSLAFGSIGAAYMGIGSELTYPARMVLIQNLTDADVLISDDGIRDKFPLSASSSLILDVATNKTKDDGFFFSKGTRFYVKQLGVPSSGSVYVTSFYGTSE